MRVSWDYPVNTCDLAQDLRLRNLAREPARKSYRWVGRIGGLKEYLPSPFLMNLVTNASDAISETGAITIVTDRVELNDEFVRTYGYGEAGKHACISVSDTGSGMDKDIRGKIFDPFFTTKEVGKGTGLGLSIVYGIIKDHGGYITVDSLPGVGTTFKIYLPMPGMDQDARAGLTNHPKSINF